MHQLTRIFVILGVLGQFVFGSTPSSTVQLAQAIQQGDLTRVKQLMKASNTIDQEMQVGGYSLITPLGLAVAANQLSIAKWLLQQGASWEEQVQDTGYVIDETVWAFAIRKGNPEMVTLFLSHGANPNNLGSFSDTPISYAIMFSTLQMVKLLESHGAKLSVKNMDSDNTQYIHIAASANNLPVAQYLLSKGADVNARTLSGFTPLHFAAGKGHMQMVQFLLQQGAKKDAKDFEGKTPRDWALEGNHTQVANLLK